MVNKGKRNLYGKKYSYPILVKSQTREQIRNFNRRQIIPKQNEYITPPPPPPPPKKKDSGQAEA